MQNTTEAIDSNNPTQSEVFKLDSCDVRAMSHDVGGVLSRLRRIVRRHPVSLLCGAATLGFFLGSTALRK